MDSCVICSRKLSYEGSDHRLGGGGQKRTEDNCNEKGEGELAPKLIVTAPGFVRTFNEIWRLLQNMKDSNSSVPNPTICLETVVMEGVKGTSVPMTKESPPNMCLRCCDKVVAVENLMKAVRQQFKEIKMLLMEESSRRRNTFGGNVEESEEPAEIQSYQSDDPDDDIQFKEEEKLSPSLFCLETLESPMDSEDYTSHSQPASNADGSEDYTMSADEDYSNHLKFEEKDEEEIQENPVILETEKIPNIPGGPGPDPFASIATTKPSPAAPPMPLPMGATLTPISFVCSYPNCNETFSNYIYFTTHQQLCHSTCSLKPGPSTTPKFPSSALSSAQGKFRCNIGNCTESFTNSRYQSRHRRLCHPGQAPPKDVPKLFTCEVEGCGKALATELGLMLHKKKLHPNNTTKLFPCDVPNCTKTFSSAIYIPRHKKVCHPEVVTLKTGESSTFICDLEGCSRVCDTKSGLYTHQIRCHPKAFAELHKDEDKPVKCSCGETFQSVHARYRHMRKKPAEHPEYIPSEIRIGGGRGMVQGQKCDLCDEQILYSDLLYHLIGHVGSHEFVVNCPNDECRHMFLTSAGLQLHLGWDKTCGEKGKEKKTGLKCDTCGFTTDQRLTLKHHVESVHELMGGTSKEIRCPISGCGKMFNVKQSIYFHLSTHRSKKITKQRCEECGVDVRVEGMEEHLRGKHGVEEVFGCKHCPLKFGGRDEWVEHLGEEHRHLGMICDVCDNQVKYVRYGDFREHYWEVHKLCPKRWKCEECGMGFWLKKNRHQHMMNKHNDKGNNGDKDNDKQGEGERKRKFICEEDGCVGGNIGFGDQQEFISHKIRVHGMEPFRCDTCGKTFNGKGGWSRHMKEHAGVELKKEWRCEVEGCGKVFMVKRSWSNHVRYGHGGMEKPFICEVCGKGFDKAARLKNHRESVHLKLKPWVCEECGEGFSSITSLKRHKLVHTGERPWRCEICGQRFRHKEVLGRHLAGHEEKGKDFKPNGSMKGIRKRKAN